VRLCRGSRWCPSLAGSRRRSVPWGATHPAAPRHHAEPWPAVASHAADPGPPDRKPCSAGIPVGPGTDGRLPGGGRGQPLSHAQLAYLLLSDCFVVQAPQPAHPSAQPRSFSHNPTDSRMAVFRPANSRLSYLHCDRSRTSESAPRFHRATRNGDSHVTESSALAVLSSITRME
jgi:hypothetical protein